MQHLDDHHLQSWLDRDRSGISRDEAAEVEDHVQDCEACAARLAELEATTQRASSLLAVAAPAAERPPDFRDVVRRSRRGASSGGVGRWWMAAGWAASLVVGMGMGWLAHDQLRSGADAGPSTAASEGETVVAAAPDDADADVPAAGEERAATLPPPPEQARATVPPPDTGATSDSALAADPDITIAPTTFSDAEAPDPPPAEPGTLHVQGQVRAEDGSPVEGAQIFARGSSLTTVTGSDGTFSLPVPADAVAADSARPLALTAQIIGFRSATREIETGASDTAQVDFQLESVALRLQAVVVTGVSPQAPAAPIIGGVADELRETWTPATRTHAESQAGFTVLIVPELAVLEIELGEIRGEVAVKVRQALDSGATLTLVQQRADSTAVEPTLPAGQPAETVERRGVRVTGSAPIAVDSLRALLDRAR